MEQMGYGQVRTNAVAPGMNRLLTEAGFTIAQELMLFSLPHWTPPRLDRKALPGCTLKRPVRLGTGLWPALRREILELDASCFGESWALDDGLLDDALRATTRSTVWIARHDRCLTGFVIAGVAGDMGYVQRLAVHSEHRQQGLATALVERAVHWAARRGARHSLVNTEVTNLPARALYEKMGFSPLPTRLTVLHKELR
jgi:GNAT superfamily N-acetyltransferase